MPCLADYLGTTVEDLNEKIEEFKEEWNEIVSIYEFIVKEDMGDEEAGVPDSALEATV